MRIPSVKYETVFRISSKRLFHIYVIPARPGLRELGTLYILTDDDACLAIRPRAIHMPGQREPTLVSGIGISDELFLDARSALT